MLYDQTDAQSKAIRALLEGKDGLQSSWVSGEGENHYSGYMARPYISEWHNGRENGYVITLYHDSSGKSLVLVFFEHRNSDSVHVIQWVADRGWLNPPTIRDIPKDVYTNKWDTAELFYYGKIGDAAAYIYSEMEDFWGRMSDACKEK